MILRRCGAFPVLILILWLVSFTTVESKASTVEFLNWDSLEEIAKYIEAARVQWKAPGLAVTIVKDDEVVMARGFGVREVGKEAPVDEHTIFALSSMGKAFAAAAVGTVVDEGLIDWDDPVVKHLPWFQMPDPWVTRQVTIRDLLSHKSGMGDEIWAATNAPRETIVRRARHMNQVSSFRVDYNYTNVGITVAGSAAAAAAGMGWHDLMTERILKPLNMKSSTTDLSSLWDPADVAACYFCGLDHPVGIEQARHDNVVMPHVLADGKVSPIAWRTVDNIAPAGSINSNAVDMAQWLRMQLSLGKYDSRRILSEKTVREMHTPQNVIRAEKLPIGPALAEAEDSFHFWAYGLGWRMNDYRGRKMIWHTGGITGFYSIMALFPDINLGVSVLTNIWRGSPNLLVYALVLRICDSYLGSEQKDWSTDLLNVSDKMKVARDEMRSQQEGSRIPDTTPSQPLESYAGRYTHPAHGEIKLEWIEGELILQFPGALKMNLTHWHYDTFLAQMHGPVNYPAFATFTLDSQRQIVGFKLQGFAEFRRLSD